MYLYLYLTSSKLPIILCCCRLFGFSSLIVPDRATVSGVEQVWQNNAAKNSVSYSTEMQKLKISYVGYWTSVAEQHCKKCKNCTNAVPRSSTEIRNKQSLIFVQKCNVTGGGSAYTAKILRETIKQTAVWQGVIVQILQYSAAHFSVVQKWAKIYCLVLKKWGREKVVTVQMIKRKNGAAEECALHIVQQQEKFFSGL